MLPDVDCGFDVFDIAILANVVEHSVGAGFLQSIDAQPSIAAELVDESFAGVVDVAFEGIEDDATLEFIAFGRDDVIAGGNRFVSDTNTRTCRATFIFLAEGFTGFEIFSNVTDHFFDQIFLDISFGFQFTTASFFDDSFLELLSFFVVEFGFGEGNVGFDIGFD